MDRHRIGLIGLGLLGGALAERLLGRGFRVFGTDLDQVRCDAFGRAGGHVVDGAVEVARTCDRVLLSLPASDAVAAVIDRMETFLRPGQIIIDTTTGDPARVVELGERLANRGVSYLDATISGSSEQARRCDVVVMAGGDRRPFDACQDVFESFARLWFHVGPCGAGTLMKLTTNLVLGLNRAALAEGLAFAGALGLDLELTLSILRGGAAYSRVMDTKGQKMLDGDFAPEARLSQHLKDVRLILAEAGRARASTPLSQAHCALLHAAEAAGFGEADNSAIIRAFANRPGASVPGATELPGAVAQPPPPAL